MLTTTRSARRIPVDADRRYRHVRRRGRRVVPVSRHAVLPDRKGEKVYALLLRRAEGSGKIGIAHVVMRDRQHLGALIPVGPLLALDTLRWQEELRPLDELSVPADDAKRAGQCARTRDGERS